MPRLSRVQRSDKTLDVIVRIGDEDDGEPVHLTVYPNRVTLGTMERARALGDSTDLIAVARLFFEFMHSWDIEDEHGKVLPFTDATAKLLTLETFNVLTKAVMEAVRPNPETSTSS